MPKRSDSRQDLRDLGQQELLFEQQYLPMIRAGTQLARILASPTPGQADVVDLDTGFYAAEAGGLSRCLPEGLEQPGSRAGGNPQRLDAGWPEEHRAGGLREAADAKRFLTRADSERLRDFYFDLAEARALMAAEYRARQPQNRESFFNVLQKYLDGRKAELRSLPPMTPAVIDR